MNIRYLFALALCSAACLLPSRPASAVTFTNNTSIGLINMSYEGADVVISNCTVTMDGAHSFSNVLIAAGGVLTHTTDGSGTTTYNLFVTDEPQTLTDTNAVSLVHSNVYGYTIEVWNWDKTLLYANSTDYNLTTDAGGITWLARTLASTIPSGSNVLVSYGYLLSSWPSRVDLTVAGDVTVMNGGAIRVDGRGYNSLTGRGTSAGSPASGGGGGNAGCGGMGSTNSSGGASIGGSFQQPTTLGGAGGNGAGGAGGMGGGSVLINCGGTFTLSGLISANGIDATNSRAGGGAGGSVWIVTTNFAGAGLISANGGAGEPVLGGGGGGGRIAIQSASNSFSGSLAAYGGPGWRNGGAGTVYLSSTNASLVVDNAGRAGTNTPLGSFSLAVDFDVTIRGGAIAQLSSSSTLANLTVASNSTLTASSSSLQITATRDVWVQSGAVIHADALGNAQNVGTGAGRSYNDGTFRPCGGGGYGGPGGNSSVASAYGGIAYGTQSSPTLVGSGGGGTLTSIGGPGGGYVRLTVSGTLIVDGRVSANGQNGSGTGGGGGSGGSVYLIGPQLGGNGLISANGGNGVLPVGGGGGGGRIFVNLTTNLFAGSVTAYGGNGTNAGGAGTILTQPFGQPPRLLLDNGGRPAGLAGTPLQSIHGFDLSIRGGAVASMSTPLSFLNLTIETNSWLKVASNGASPFTLDLTVSTNAVIQAGGGITTDGLGYSGNNGPGRGNYGYVYLPSYTYVGSGGGHGGYGGNSISNAAAGGVANDFATLISYPGSGGGGLETYSYGGPGGGRMLITVNRTLLLNGKISANGANGQGAGGGGAGGGIRLGVNTLTGTGQITAHGGDGTNGWGGGGGGGRIFVTYQTNTLNGVGGVNGIAAYGGGGAFRGGAGTVALGNSPAGGAGALYCDNNGNRGTNTLLETTFSGDLTVRGGAVATAPNTAGFSYRSILVRSNAALVASSSLSGATINVTSNVVIEVGGAMNWDGIVASGGGGAGNISSFGGGGHGGVGGNNVSGYGLPYGSITSPQTLGSVGGRNSNYPSSQAGLGGGALRLNINGVLQVDGQLTVRGLSGVLGNSPGLGGGSGGSLWLSLNRFVGTGLVSADGGAGLGSGGGGGGGRIAVTWSKWVIGNSNVPDFSGVITAQGGAGSIAGGAGTVYSKRSDQAVARLLLNNGGLFGTNTPIGSSYGMPTGWFDFTAVNGAQAYFSSAPTTLNNLNLMAGGTLMLPSAQSTLNLTCRSNMTIAAGGVITMDGRGYPRGSGGSTAGGTLSSKGAGGGHGGAGGAASSGAPGGGTVGSATEPSTFGGGGGAGANSFTDGCEGGGAIRLIVPGILTVDGLLTAGGRAGVQDDSGGGAGGSIWATANALAGSGVVAADGGDGEFYGGGGGGAGRIALYANNTNAFTGILTALGGDGASAGQNGTIIFSTNQQPFSITGSSPSGGRATTVDSVAFIFNQPVDPATVSPAFFALSMPSNYAGPLPVLATAANGNTVTLNITPAVNVAGDYSIVVTPSMADVFGTPMTQPYTNSLSLTPPTVEGFVRDTNNTGVAGVTIQTPGYLPTTTDATGYYALGVAFDWTGTITPSFGVKMFAPGSIALANITSQTTNQNFLMVDTILPTVNTGVSGTNLFFNWSGFSGVTYQAYWSTNLLDWSPWGGPIPGTNAAMQLGLPVGNDAQGFFRLGASN